MPLSIQCQCGRTYRVPDSAAGKKVRCKECNSFIAVPRGKKKQTTPAPEKSGEDGLLNQLFDEDEDFTVPAKDDRTPPPVKPLQEQVFKHRTSPDVPEPPPRRELGHIATVAIVLGFIVAAMLIEPRVAGLLMKGAFGLSWILLGIAYISALVLVRREGPGHLLFYFVFPPYLFLFILTHLDESRGVLFCVAAAFAIAIVVSGVAVVLQYWHGMSLF